MLAEDLSINLITNEDGAKMGFDRFDNKMDEDFGKDVVYLDKKIYGNASPQKIKRKST